jgi:hypothetical protein
MSHTYCCSLIHCVFSTKERRQTIVPAMQQIKSASSHWMSENCAIEDFEWQAGYGAFSIGWSQVETPQAYIARQEEHHRQRDFQTEFLAFLKKHRIEYNPRYVWG